jgi:hypothetical protein
MLAVQHRLPLALAARVRSCRRPFRPSPGQGPYRLPHDVRDRLVLALAPFRNRDAALTLAVFIARYWSVPGRVAGLVPHRPARADRPRRPRTHRGAGERGHQDLGGGGLPGSGDPGQRVAATRPPSRGCTAGRSSTSSGRSMVRRLSWPTNGLRRPVAAFLEPGGNPCPYQLTGLCGPCRWPR